MPQPRWRTDTYSFNFHLLVQRIYLDYAATTPVEPDVLMAMQPYFSARFGNPGSLHSFGQEAVAALDESRENIAKTLGADFREIIFTSSATEANNLALKGVFWSAQSLFRELKFIVSSIEHESVLETAGWLEKHGAEIIYLPTDRAGIVDLKKLEEELDENTILVSIMSANNEIGTIEPIAEIFQIICRFREELKVKSKALDEKSSGAIHRSLSGLPLFHVDHSQGFQYLDIRPKNFGIDLLTISSHKIYGPKGAAALCADLRLTSGSQQHFLNPLITGGGQEFGLRSGTENVAAVAGFAKAAKLISDSRESENKKISELRNYFWREVKKIFPKAELNGPPIGINLQDQAKSARLPNNLNIYFPGHSAEELLIKLDMAGIAASAGSACSARATKLSHVLQVCGFSEDRIKSSLRFTLGRPTTKTEIKEAIRRMKKILK